MSEFKTEKNIPLPPKNVGGRTSKYPFGDMDVGDSFFVPKGEMHRVSGAAIVYSRRRGIKFTTRKVDGGVRVWRIA